MSEEFEIRLLEILERIANDQERIADILENIDEVGIRRKGSFWG